MSAAATSMLRNHTPDAQSTTAISASAGAAAKRNPGSRRPDARPLRAASSASTASNASSTGSAEPATTPTDMVFIPPATLTMRPDAREVSVRGFYLDRAEVSVHAYEGCLRKRMCGAADHVALPPSAIQHWWTGGDADANEPTPPPSEYTDTWTRRCNAPRGLGAHPINCVDFASAEAYCRWAGKRLPTEAEWELATRGTQGRPYPWGDSAPSCQSACYDKNGGCLQRGESVSTCPSGKTPGDRTPEGVLDLAGNVSEWVRDGSGDPTARVARGASFIDTDDRLNATYRLELPASAAHVAIGFRCAKEAP